MKKLKTWQLVLLIVFYPVGIIYLIIWLCNKNKKAMPQYNYSHKPTQSIKFDTSKLPVVRDFHTKVVGVTFGNDDGSSRQDIIRKCNIGDDLVLKPTPSKEFPESIGVFTVDGKQLGNLNADLSNEIHKEYRENFMSVVIANITGGGDYNYGCNLHIIIYGAKDTQGAIKI